MHYHGNLVIFVCLMEGFHSYTSHSIKGKNTKYSPSSGSLQWHEQPLYYRSYGCDNWEDKEIQEIFSLSLAVNSVRRTYELRVNPSSGNLHPVEAYCLRENKILHYKPRKNDLELVGKYQDASSEAIVFVLSLNCYRQIWKYGPRGLRYALLGNSPLPTFIRSVAKVSF